MKKNVLITVKAYPNPSTKYGETVCCAGIDLEEYRLLRLYPIPFRDLDDNKKFKKYSIIEVNCFSPKNDKRPESYRVDSDSIYIKGWLDTEGGSWAKRKTIVFKTEIKSMCQVQKDSQKNDLSLGLIKPTNISFDFIKQTIHASKARAECYSQLSFFNKRKNAIEEIPYRFYYNFSCVNEDECPGHRLSIIDWEVGQAFRDWRKKYESEIALLEKIREKWLDIADEKNRNVFFFVGNMKRFRQTFMVLGVFYPPLRK